jgi:hypothetical protein
MTRQFADNFNGRLRACRFVRNGFDPNDQSSQEHFPKNEFPASEPGGAEARRRNFILCCGLSLPAYAGCFLRQWLE